MGCTDNWDAMAPFFGNWALSDRRSADDCGPWGQQQQDPCSFFAPHDAMTDDLDRDKRRT